MTRLGELEADFGLFFGRVKNKPPLPLMKEQDQEEDHQTFLRVLRHQRFLAHQINTKEGFP